MRTIKILRFVLVFAATLSCPLGNAGAATVRGVSFPDAVDIGGRECRLNGVGVRTRFLVSVYLGALYLATPTGDAASAVAADEAKRTVLHFVKSRVEAEKIREAWREGFAENAGADWPQLAERLARFSAWFEPDLLEGEQIVLTYVPGRGTEVAVKGTVRGVIEGADFMRALWSVWLGPKPVDAGLKKGMLGR